jgi:hypothetical protein
VLASQEELCSMELAGVFYFSKLSENKLKLDLELLEISSPSKAASQISNL